MSCPRCDGRGHICPDDMCRGCGECIHGDCVCPVCFGDEDYVDGRYDEDDEADYRYDVERDER